MSDLFDIQYLDKTKELINRRMNQILVTSYLYEVKNASTINWGGNKPQYII